LKILFAGGGTGGHLYPALAIAEEIRKLSPQTEFLFVGTKNKIEARVVPQRGFRFETIWISGFSRRLRFENLFFPVKVFVSLIQSFLLLREFKPNIVVGTGGYVSGPVLFSASLMKIPTAVHESNSYPGVTTRLLAARASIVFIAFEETLLWLARKDNARLVGTPTRDELAGATRAEAAAFFGLEEKKRTVFAFGGSLGAVSINDAIARGLDELLGSGVQLIWQTGATDFSRIQSQVGLRPGLWFGAYIDRMDLAYAIADVVVSRAGAMTIAEVTRLGKPTIFIPLPHAAEDHQTKNAKSLVEAGAAVMIQDGQARSSLHGELQRLLADDAHRASLSKACKKFGKPDAGRVIAETILQLSQ